jgi:outer membrane autotransporter protein
VSGPTGSVEVETDTKTRYGGAQVGIDAGACNVFGTGWNAHLGVTGGYLGVDSQDRISGARASYNVPFVGVYAAFIGHGFFADVQVRGDFYGSHVTDLNLGVINQSHGAVGLSVAASAGYQITFGTVFLEPSASFIWSHVTIDSLAVPGGGPLNVPAGEFRFNEMDSLLGRAGVRIGTTLQAGDLAWQPFVSANVLHEFAGEVNSTYIGGGFLIPTETHPIGTFAQLGLGLAVVAPKPGVAGYIRVDYRRGEHIEGLGINGGLRWNFYGDVAPVVGSRS